MATENPYEPPKTTVAKRPERKPRSNATIGCLVLLMLPAAFAAFFTTCTGTLVVAQWLMPGAGDFLYGGNKFQNAFVVGLILGGLVAIFVIYLFIRSMVRRRRKRL